MAGAGNYYETYWSEKGFCPNGAITPALAQLIRANIRTGWRCLDVGCGDGRTAGLCLRDHGCEYVGVDVSENAVRAAQALGLEAQKIDDAASLPFPEATFDAAVCIEVMEHLFDPHLAATDISRVLRPGGVLIVTVPNVAYWRRRIDLALLGRWNPLGDNLAVVQPWRDPHLRFFNPGSLRRMLTSVGFHPVTVGGHGGSLVRDVPWIGRKLWRGKSSRLYRTAERAAPSLLAYRLHAVAFKPTSGK
jgi:SAM-dependent methyltransferase